jgi:hypothetical protein
MKYVLVMIYDQTERQNLKQYITTKWPAEGIVPDIQCLTDNEGAVSLLQKMQDGRFETLLDYVFVDSGFTQLPACNDLLGEIRLQFPNCLVMQIKNGPGEDSPHASLVFAIVHDESVMEEERLH